MTSSSSHDSDIKRPINRRTFLRGSLAAIPTLLVLKSLPGLAATSAYSPAGAAPAITKCTLSPTNLLNLKSPTDVTFNGDRIWIAESRGYRVRSVAIGEAFPPQDQLNAGNGNGKFDFPLGLVTLPDGTVAVADTWNHRVQLLSPDGANIGYAGGYARRGTPWDASISPSPGYEDGQFHAPEGLHSMAYNGMTLLAVADCRNHRVQVLQQETNSTWRALYIVGTLGEDNDNLRLPSGCAMFDASGAFGLVVVDRGHSRSGGSGRVKVYLPSGSGKTAGKILRYSHDLALGSELDDPRRVIAINREGRTILAVSGIVGKHNGLARVGLYDATDGKAIDMIELIKPDGIANPVGLSVCRNGCHLAVAHAGKLPDRNTAAKDGLIQIVELMV